MLAAEIRAIAHYLPPDVLSNESLHELFPDLTPEKILDKTGIAQRHVAGEGVCASDLAYEAAKSLFASGACQPQDIDFLLFCSQTPDHFLPTTACLIQERLGLPNAAGAIDVNQGCSGFVYSLSLAKGLLETGQARKILLLTGDTYSRNMHPSDRGSRTIFGDGASATLVSASDSDGASDFGPIIFGTDGRGAPNLIRRTGAFREAPSGVIGQDKAGNFCSPDFIYMNGPEIFNFTLKAVPQSVAALLAKAGITLDQVDKFVFHQANQYMLEHLRRKLGIPPEKFIIEMRNCANTTSSTIPIALEAAARDGRIRAGDRVMLVGFGVGYSWAAALIRWSPAFA